MDQKVSMGAQQGTYTHPEVDKVNSQSCHVRGKNHREYVTVRSKIRFYLLMDGCKHEDLARCLCLCGLTGP